LDLGGQSECPLRFTWANDKYIVGHVCKVITCYVKKGFIFLFIFPNKTHIHEHKVEWDMTTVMANKAAEYHNDAKESDSDGDI
jgi:hypothetical protein